MKDKNARFSGQDQPERINPRDEDIDINTDENVAGGMHLNEGGEDESAIARLNEELQAQKEKYLRLFAEFDNFRKRTAREKIETIQTAGKDVIGSLLDVLDDCDRAEKQLQTSQDINEIKAGVMLVFNKLRAVLQAKGLKAMDSLNTDFDVEKHEAITEIPAPTPASVGKVIDEVTKGYYLNDKLIRFAKVVVGK